VTDSPAPQPAATAPASAVIAEDAPASGAPLFDADRFPVVLFDLDGTIADSRPGIEGAMRSTLDHFDLPQPGAEEFRTWIGPPVLDTFRDRIGLRGEQLTEALAFYVDRYETEGWRDSTLYDGIPELIADLAAAGRTLGVATSKREGIARTMLAHFGLSSHFAFEGGAGEDGTRGTKALVIEHTLTHLDLAPEGDRQVDGVVLLGDRIHDIDGANEYGIPTLLAGWGYGDSLERKCAHAIAETAGDARTMLGL
jgi:phosphoglycolate phosphatase